MSVVSDRVRQIDAQLNRIPLNPPPTSFHTQTHPQLQSQAQPDSFHIATAAFELPRINRLLQIAKDLSTTSSSAPQLSAWSIVQLLEQSGLPDAAPSPTENSDKIATAIASKNHYETEIEWRLVAKAAIQTFGLVMETLLEENISLEDDLWYWNELLSSYRSSTIYTVQTSPLRLWALTQEVYSESKIRFQSMQAQGLDSTLGQSRDAFNLGWNRFYTIVKDTIHERSLYDVRGKLMTPFALCQAEARSRRKQLKRMRQMTASGLGMLMDEGLIFGDGGTLSATDDRASTESESVDDAIDWKGPVERSVALVDMVLNHVLSLDTNVTEFEEKVFSGVEEDPCLSSFDSRDATGLATGPSIIAKRLVTILRDGLPRHKTHTHKLVRQNGRPGLLVRYWLPASIAILSSGAILRLLTNRKAELIEWVQGLGETARDFYFNWVVEPIAKLVHTIRHDEKSEFAIMSRDSLKADLESLERMVVDFAKDRPQFVVSGAAADSYEQTAMASAAPLSAAQIADIQAKVSEGDVTPVLRAYEQNIRHPFSGTIRGDLVRALLIQIQQTKVDLKVTISGIDSLLKSQELLFGFLGLTPGILVTAALGRYLGSIFSSGGRTRQTGNSRKAVMILRNIDRILSEAQPMGSGNGNGNGSNSGSNGGVDGSDVLSYKEHGLLLCEIHVLRNLVHRADLLPRGEILESFLQDIEALANGKMATQKAALERIRWTYGRWIRA
ncbi:Nuclear control of ATPase protein 2 [Ceratocystis pirilliformis]|uniref:Nuclear control of ATPase protein 2 n=1 Tax=Ceratocystis pirilliformis TaxID=259994 RepID=A0ABR3ZB96_9PEZI